MKKVSLVIMALFVLSFNQVFASDLNRFSDDYKVVSALRVLENAGENEVFTRLSKSSTKVIFYDLTLMDFSYAKHYAVSSTDENGNNYILINEKFKSAPTEAIASLIAHESVHQLSHATLDEEVRATTTEAQTWIRLRGGASANTTDNDLVRRLNKLAMMYQSSTSGNNLIKQSIENNSFYQQQLAMK